MSDIYPLTIVKDKHNGIYSGGKWTAWNRNPWEISHIVSSGDDKDCADLFSTYNLIFGRGETPQEAIDDLNHMIKYGSHMVIERIKEVNKSTENKEDEEMESATIWEIADIDNIRTSHESDKMSILLDGKEGSSKIVLTGEAIKYRNDHFTTILTEDVEKLEKENKELKKENKRLNYECDGLTRANDTLYKTITENFADEEPSSRRDILRCAEKCVCGQREQDYGTPESNFQLIADLWNDYLGNNLSKEKKDFENELGIVHKKLSVPWQISAMDVSMMMALMKIARIRNGGGSGDSFVDLAGYAACGGEIWHLKKVTNGDLSQETN